MQELISPEQAEKLVALAALLLTVFGATAGYRAVRPQGSLAGLCGPLLYGLWVMHKYVTRFDPATGYLGLDKVRVLVFEVVLFVAVGAALGWAWNILTARQSRNSTD